MELLDVYDDFGNITGKKIVRGDKSVKLTPNEHIAVAIVFIENSSGEFLIQKTSLEKGGKYSSTGGHIDSGETPSEAIKREIKEELGISVDNDKIESLGYVLYDKPLRYVFYLKKDINLKKVNIQKEEVASIEYMSKEKIFSLIDNNLFLTSHAILFNIILKEK
jgi:mutator protein MutT